MVLLLAVSVIPLLNIAGVVVRCFLDVTGSIGVDVRAWPRLVYKLHTIDTLLPYNI